MRTRSIGKNLLRAAGLVTMVLALSAPAVFASGGSSTGGGGGGTITSGGGTTVTVDTIKVSKCFFAQGAYVLLNASSSDSSAHVYAYLPSGVLLGEVLNGRYGGTIWYVGADPGSITFKSSSGGTITAPTTPGVI